MLRTHLDSISHSTKFIRDALSHNIRLDGRQALECREVELNLDRDETSSRCEVIMGRTRALSKVRCDVVTPYTDRPSEGMIQFNASLSVAAEGGMFSNGDIVRSLEKSIRESDAIDTESLCIISGERVWLISCEIVVLDYDGNLIDAAILAAMTSLRALRRPDVYITTGDALFEDNNDTSAVESAATGGSGTRLHFYSSDEREPLPLALHHLPLSISLAIFSKSISEDIANNSSSSNNKESDISSGGEDGERVMLLVDPIQEEEKCMDGVITYSLNEDNDLCALNKPGGIGVHTTTILNGLRIAKARAVQLHEMVIEANKQLEVSIDAERESRMAYMRKIAFAKQQKQAAAQAGHAGQTSPPNAGQTAPPNAGGGIDRDDPVLGWNLLHRVHQE